MSKNKKILTMLARGGMSQEEIASILHCGKRDVSLAAKTIKEHGLCIGKITAMGEAAMGDAFIPKAPRAKDPAYLQLDMEAFVERKEEEQEDSRQAVLGRILRIGCAVPFSQYQESCTPSLIL